MKLLITGICGFVGSTLARYLLNARYGLTIYGLDNLIRQGSELNRGELLKLGIKLFHGDIRIQSDFDTLPDVDWLIDAAANPSVLAGVDGKTSSRQLIEHNLCGTVNMLEYCKRHQAGFILISTSRVYSIKPLSEIDVEVSGNAYRLKENAALPQQVVRECNSRTACQGVTPLGVNEQFSTIPPLSLYGSTKFASEILALEYGEMFNFPVWINRCGVLAGAGQFGKADQGIFAFWINAYLRRSPLQYIGFGGHGYQVRDALHPRDLTPLLLNQMSNTSSQDVPQIINLGGGITNAMSLAEISEWCADRFGWHEILSDPHPRQFDIPWIVMDYSVARQIWDWQPQTSLQQILTEIAEHAERNPDWLQISGAL